jgi:hypothetical protein
MLNSVAGIKIKAVQRSGNCYHFDKISPETAATFRLQMGTAPIILPYVK